MTDFLLWFDNTKTPQAAKIEAAAQRYQQKFGQPADTCLVNAGQFDPATTVLGVEIKPAHNVLKNHLHIGATKKAGNSWGGQIAMF